MLSAVLLAACGSDRMAYDLHLTAAAGLDTDEIIGASVRMVERRVEAISDAQGWTGAMKDIDVRKTENGARITVQATKTELLPFLTEDLTEPFSFEFMEEVPVEDSDVVVADSIGYRNLALNGQDVRWLVARDGGETALVTVQFTEEGRARKKQVFSENVGEELGLFVRKHPVYRFLVEQNDVSEDTFTIKVPQKELAEVFADDVNAGLHASFSPVE